ncbi:hypothetical protein TIFTF001_039132 [Ficus carica]|uniref:Uncharacterized protein n=1 Tax=Ficus carica TaxID=3494 RepID=A0AA88JDM6_FICCA|nr:hypothetical protein TIFTF001_039129 [Ficus carica]GMN70087.1 hypothetical protein TIFTF001_039132 [Ficus carica]
MLRLYRMPNMAHAPPLDSLHHKDQTFEHHAPRMNEHHISNTSDTNLHSTHASQLQYGHDEGIETSKLQSC